MARRAKQKELRRVLREGSIDSILSDGGNILFNDREDSLAVFRFFKMHQVIKNKPVFDQVFSDLYDRYRVDPEYSKQDAMVEFCIDMERTRLIDKVAPYLAEINEKRKEVKLFRGVKPALQTIYEAKIPFIIMTDAGKPGKQLEKYLSGWGISEYVTDIISSVDVCTTKPDPEFFGYVLDKHKIDAERFVFVAHSKDELEGAVDLGYATLACRPDSNVKGTGYVEVAGFKDVPKALKIERPAA